MKATDYGFRVRTTLPVIGKQRYYDNTFLNGDDGAVLFVVDAALIEGKRGRFVRAVRDVLEFPTVKAMLSALVAGKWVEAPVEDRNWRPTAEMLADKETPNE